MKKSIAVLSLSLAATFGLAACGGNSGGSTSSPSASAGASASATASAPASASAVATSASTTSAAAETTKAETKTTQGTISAPSALPSEASEALKKSEESNQQATSALYRASKESLNEFKEDSSVKKAQTSDGTVYYNDEVATFESKDGAIVIIKNTGAWSSFDSNRGTIVVDEDGSWIKTNPEDSLYTAVRADGAAAVLNTKTLEQATDLSTIDIPKALAPSTASAAPLRPRPSPPRLLTFLRLQVSSKNELLPPGPNSLTEQGHQRPVRIRP